MKLGKKQQYWLDHIRQAEQSGETFKRYAEQHGLDLNALYDWRSRLMNKDVLDAPPRPVAKKAVTFAKVVAVLGRLPFYQAAITLRAH